MWNYLASSAANLARTSAMFRVIIVVYAWPCVGNRTLEVSYYGDAFGPGTVAEIKVPNSVSGGGSVWLCHLVEVSKRRPVVDLMYKPPYKVYVTAVEQNERLCRVYRVPTAISCTSQEWTLFPIQYPYWYFKMVNSTVYKDRYSQVQLPGAL
jgi:hypothetical protein